MLEHGGVEIWDCRGFWVFDRLILDLGGPVLGFSVVALWGVIFVFGAGQCGFTGCWVGVIGFDDLCWDRGGCVRNLSICIVCACACMLCIYVCMCMFVS